MKMKYEMQNLVPAALMLMLLFPLSANSCPDLVGKYRCDSRSKFIINIIEQGIKDDGTPYYIARPSRGPDREYLLDGVSHRYVDEEIEKFYTGFCHENSIVTEKTIYRVRDNNVRPRDENIYLQSKSIITIILVEDSLINVVMGGSFAVREGLDGKIIHEDQLEEESYLCRRN